MLIYSGLNLNMHNLFSEIISVVHIICNSSESQRTL